MKKYLLLIAISAFILACNQDSKITESTDSIETNMTILNTNEKPEQIADVPWSVQIDSSTQKMTMVKSKEVDDEDLSPDNVIEALGRKYPEIKLVWVKQKSDTAFVSIPDAHYLSRASGSMGADIFMRESTYSFTQIPGIKLVSYDFKPGDHASPGIFSREDFDFK